MGKKRGYDAAKKTKGRKRHLLVDGCGMIIKALVTGADVQDRDGACLLIDGLEPEEWPRLEEIVGDSAYSGEKVELAALVRGWWDVLIVKRSDEQPKEGFHVQPIRWIVERTFAWLSRCRRLAKDVEKMASSSLAMIHLAMIRLMLRRLAPQQKQS